MRKAWLFWSACALCLLYSCAVNKKTATVKENNDDTLRIMTYNIRHGAPVHKAENAIDLVGIAAVINASRPDLVALQEVDSMTRRAPFDEARELGRLTGMHYYFSRTIHFQGGSYGDAILSRYPILATAHHLLPMPVKGEDRAIGMVTTEPFPGMKIVFATTHLALKRKDRMAQVNMLEQIARKSTHPLVIAGDFNAMPGSAAIGELKGFFTFGCHTGCPLTFPSDKPRRTIDYVISGPAAARKLRSAGYQAVAHTTASDHLPLIEYLVKQ